MTDGQAGATPRRFGYLGDPVFALAVIAYFVNRWALKPLTGDPADFWHCYANDVLCVPFWLPPQLRLARALGLRKHDLPPTITEIVVMVVVWSWLFELAVPSPALRGLFPICVADELDVVAYAIGGLAAGMLWRSGRDPVDPSAPGVTRRQLRRIAAGIVLATTVTAMLALSWVPEEQLLRGRQLRERWQQALAHYMALTAAQGLALGVLIAAAWLVRSSLRPEPWPHLAGWPLLRTLAPPALCATVGIGVLFLQNTTLTSNSH